MADDSLISLLDERRKIVRVEHLAMSLGEIVSMYKSGELILRPEYQRLLKWNEKQKTLFIESLLLGLPTPTVFVASGDEGKWEVVDGLQRVSTVIDFIAGLKSEDTGDIPNYEPFKKLSDDLVYLTANSEDQSFVDKSFEHFPQKIQLELRRQRINVVVLLSDTTEDVKYELFQRLNEGGTRITSMEMRNAIFVSRNSKLWQKIDRVGQSQSYAALFPDRFIRDDNSYNKYNPILYFMAIYDEFDAIESGDKKIPYIDPFITKYVRDLEQQKGEVLLSLFERVVEKLNSLDLSDARNVFSSGQRYSDTVFGIITLGIAINFDGLPNDMLLKNKIENIVEAIKEDTQSPILQRGLSASARIPRMLKFAKQYFQV